MIRTLHHCNEFEGEYRFSLFAPAGTPAVAVEVLRNAHASILREPELTARVERDRGRAMALPPQEQQRFPRTEAGRWSAQVTQHGVAVEEICIQELFRAKIARQPGRG